MNGLLCVQRGLKSQVLSEQGRDLCDSNNNRLRTTIYRKPTQTDRLLDQSLYNPTSHKDTTIRTLTRRAQLVCDPPDSLQDETETEPSRWLQTHLKRLTADQCTAGSETHVNRTHTLLNTGGILHAHACIRLRTIAWAHQI